MLFHTEAHPMPMETRTPPLRRAFWEQLMSEVPAFINHLVNQFEVPEVYTSGIIRNTERYDMGVWDLYLDFERVGSDLFVPPSNAVEKLVNVLEGRDVIDYLHRVAVANTPLDRYRLNGRVDGVAFSF